MSNNRAEHQEATRIPDMDATVPRWLGERRFSFGGGGIFLVPLRTSRALLKLHHRKKTSLQIKTGIWYRPGRFSRWMLTKNEQIMKLIQSGNNS